MARKAVVIGCNYPGTMARLNGCINDVKRMQKCLVERYHFSDKDITVLIDTDYSYTQPTGHNIRAALADLVNSAQPGDFLFVHYSGHGTRLPTDNFRDDTGYDECIVPTDMNLITDNDIRELVNKVPEGCQITIVSDSCHSGGLIDEAKEQIGQSTYQRQAEKEEEGEGEEVRNFLHKNVEDKAAYKGEGYFKDKYLPPSTLMKLLQQKKGKEEDIIDVGKLRPTLLDVFGDDASPEVKKSMNGFGKLQGEGSGGGVVLQNYGGYAEPVWVMHDAPAPAPALAPAPPVWERGLSDTGILISGCQTHETSADYSPSGNKIEPYGALSNAIQAIIVESDGKVSNRQLVRKARVMLKKQGLTQRPGLYCSDHHVDASFLC